MLSAILGKHDVAFLLKKLACEIDGLGFAEGSQIACCRLVAFLEIGHDLFHDRGWSKCPLLSFGHAERHKCPVVAVDSDNRTLVSFRMPEGQEGAFRPTAIMKKIVTYLQERNEATARDLRTLGKSQAVDLACQLLQEEGDIVLTKNGRKHVYTLRPRCTYKLIKKSA